jgi:hypothetical protein
VFVRLSTSTLACIVSPLVNNECPEQADICIRIPRSAQRVESPRPKPRRRDSGECRGVEVICSSAAGCDGTLHLVSSLCTVWRIQRCSIRAHREGRAGIEAQNFIKRSSPRQSAPACPSSGTSALFQMEGSHAELSADSSARIMSMNFGRRLVVGRKAEQCSRMSASKP